MPAAIGELIQSEKLTRLQELDDFNLVSILDRVTMADLISLAALDTRMWQLIADHVVNVKFLSHKRKIYVAAGNHPMMWYENVNGSNILITTQQEEIYSALRYFGHLFESVDILIHENSHEYSKRLEILVNKHCSHAFQKISLSDSSIIDADLAFPNASEIVLNVRTRSSNNQIIIPLDTVFPKLQSLKINSQSYYNHHLPHLRKFILDVYEPDMDSLITFMRLNPQLRSLTSTIPNNATYFTTLNEFLPELEELSVELMPTYSYSVAAWPTTRFSHVKHFSVKSDTERWARLPILESIQFEHLQSYSVRFCNKENVAFFISMIVGNTALKKVVIGAAGMSVQQLAALISSLPELEELTIVWGDPALGNQILQFLRYITARNHQLTKLVIEPYFNISSLAPEFLQSIPLGWSCTNAMALDKPESLQILRIR